MSTRELVRQLMAEHDLPYFVTFNFGSKVHPIAGGEKVVRFINVVQDAAYGGRWAKRRGAERVTAIGVWERLDLNPHLHCGLYAPEAVADVIFNQGPELWLRGVARGQLDVERSRSRKRVRNYSTKAIWLPEHQDRLFLYVPPGGSGVRFDDLSPKDLRGVSPRPQVPLHRQWRS